MNELFKTIRNLVEADRYLVSWHALERLDERGIVEWQVVAGLSDGELIAERPDDQPHPSIEVRQTLPDGTEIKAIWSHLEHSGVAQLVTVHYFDRD